ncbi:MAG: hypothetical protein ACKV2U_28855 [Bryobacteraceae bacterium]
MTRLTVYFDARCGLCVAMARWIASQRQLTPLLCVPKLEGVDDLVVTADSGEMWTGNAAWLMVIWALDEYRDWSYRLSGPSLLPLARQAFATLSQNRTLLSKWLRLKTDYEVGERLRDVSIPGCAR